MAYLVRFRIEGLAGRQSAYAQTLDRHRNVFFGLNGSGKTSLLKILDSAMSADATSLAGVPFAEAEVEIYSHDLKRSFLRTFSRTNPVQSPSEPRLRSIFRDPSEVEYSWKTTPDEKPFLGPYTHVFLPISRMFNLPKSDSPYTYWRDPQSAPSLETQLNEAFAQTLKDAWKDYMARVSGGVRVAQAQGLANVLRTVLTSSHPGVESEPIDPELAFAQLRAFLRRQGSQQILPTQEEFRRLYESNPNLRSVVRDIEQVEATIAAVSAPRRKLQNLIKKMFQDSKSVVFDEQDVDVQVGDKGKISLGSLSSGEKQVLRLLVETLRAGTNTLLIDEPELSMHIDWQRELLSAMHDLNPMAQVIVATHSPEIMADIDDSNIFQL